MVYVQRDGDAIVGVFAVLQPGFAEEQIAPDAPEVLNFRSRNFQTVMLAKDDLLIAIEELKTIVDAQATRIAALESV
jgi:hypothetical protein